MKSHGLLTASNTSGLGEVLTCKRFSSLSQLFSVTTLVFIFCNILLNKIWPGGAFSHILKDVTVKEAWILEAQQMVTLDRNFQQWKKQLDLFKYEKGV